MEGIFQELAQGALEEVFSPSPEGVLDFDAADDLPPLGEMVDRVFSSERELGNWLKWLKAAGLVLVIGAIFIGAGGAISVKGRIERA